MKIEVFYANHYFASNCHKHSQILQIFNSFINTLINELINSISHSFNQLFITTKTTVAWHITKVNFLGPLKDMTSMLTSLAQLVVKQAMNPRVMGLNPASNNRFMSLLLNPEAFCMPVG